MSDDNPARNVYVPERSHIVVHRGSKLAGVLMAWHITKGEEIWRDAVASNSSVTHPRRPLQCSFLYTLQFLSSIHRPCH